jgi:hypothetical protein
VKRRTRAVMLFGGMVTALAVASPALAAGTWTVINPPDPPGSTFAELNSAFATSPTQAWAVGESRVPASGDNFNALIEEWNGSAWSIVPGANVGPATSTTPLYGVSGSGPDDVWAVGQDSNTNTSLIEHWNGTSWDLVASPATEPANAQLNTVSADSPTDAWAGGYAFPGTITSLIEHWNGTAWTVVPNAAPSVTEIISIAAVSPSDVWALGRVGTGPQRDRSNVMEHWNGSQWSVVTLPTSALLSSISAVSANDVWAVGNDGVIDQWNGSQWNQVANPDGGATDLFDVHALSADDVWTVNGNGTVTEQWNGTQWNSVPPAASIPAGFGLGGYLGGNSLSGVPGGPLFAVGGNSGGGNNQAAILEQPQP